MKAGTWSATRWIVAFGVALSVLGCGGEEDSPGEQVEEGMEEAGDAVGDAADELGDAVDDAADSIEDSAEEVDNH